MKTNTTIKPGSFKTFFSKVLVVTALFALALTNKTSAQTIYARFELQQFAPSPSPFVVIAYADVNIRYYADYNCSVAVPAPDDGTLYYTATVTDSSSGTASYPGNGAPVTINDTATYFGQWTTYYADYYDYDCMFLRWEQYSSFELDGYALGSTTVIGLPTLITP